VLNDKKTRAIQRMDDNKTKEIEKYKKKSEKTKLHLNEDEWEV
jgi:hypothetical protein